MDDRNSFESNIVDNAIHGGMQEKYNIINNEKENFNKLNTNIKDVFTKLTENLNNLNSKVNNIEQKVNNNFANDESNKNKNLNTISGDLKVDLNLIPLNQNKNHPTQNIDYKQMELSIFNLVQNKFEELKKHFDDKFDQRLKNIEKRMNEIENSNDKENKD